MVSLRNIIKSRFQRYKSEKGMSLIEVLIASAMFMMGFTFLVFLLNNTTQQLSFKETLIAKSLGEKYMDETLLGREMTSDEFSEKISNINFIVNREVEIKDNLANIRIIVSRKSSNKEIIRLYSEKFLHQIEK